MRKHTPKETILWFNREKKTICLCAECETIPLRAHIKPYTTNWNKKGYTVSHGCCDKCEKEYMEKAKNL